MTSFKWVVACTAIIPAVVAQKGTAVVGSRIWLTWRKMISALLLGVATVVGVVSHMYRNVARAIAATAVAKPDNPACHACMNYRVSGWFPCTGLGELLNIYETVPPTNSHSL